MEANAAIAEIRSSLELMARLSVLIRDAQALCMGQINDLAVAAAVDGADSGPGSPLLPDPITAQLPETPPCLFAGPERFAHDDPYAAAFNLDFFLDDY